MSRIYVVKGDGGGPVTRYVRAHTLGGAIRAVAEEHFEARAATAEDVVQAATSGRLAVLDATLKPEQVDIEDAADPGHLPLRAV